MYNIPILLITFNRPVHTRRVLEAIVEQNPSDLFVFQDGPRNGNIDDVKRIEEVRAVVGSLANNTSITLHTFFSEKNFGCGPGPAAGISWFFENVDRGIIIEDDAVPHSDFFKYAEELLEKYKDDEIVRAIGSMKIDPFKHGDGSYYFSRINRNLCAWATWKRAWNDFDIRMEKVSRNQLNSVLKDYGCKLREREYWLDRLDEIHKDGIGGSSWDMQFFMSIWTNHGKGIMPNVNLSTNIGFDEAGTHTKNSDNVAANVPTESIFPLKYPSSEDIDTEADLLFHKLYFTPYQYGWRGIKNLPYRLNKRLKRCVGHTGPWLKKK